MKPLDFVSRRAFLMSLGWPLGGALLTGCTGFAVRSQSPEDPVETLGSQVKLVGDLAVPFGMSYIAIESVGLVTGLPGTGSDPAPSPQRAALLADMQTRGVQSPHQLLSSPNTEMVMVRGFLRPGIQKGDPFDIEVRVLGKSECQSLRDGWLMECRLREMAVLGNAVREGSMMALAEGAILVDPSATSDDKVLQCRGRVLSGGVSQVSRQMGLVLKPDARNVLNSTQIGNVINRRFHIYEGGLKQGVAKPKTDEFVELKLHPRYKDNAERYTRVIRSLALRESPVQQQARMQLLERQLLDPITAAQASLRLEAIGPTAVEILRKGLQSPTEEVKFYAAEGLAYLDDRSAAEPLGQLARDVPAFRAYALTALSAMDDYAAYEALRELLHTSSAETRYGAFRALWAMNARDPLVRGEMLGNQFSYHVLDTTGSDMVHVTRCFRPEVVLFGRDQRLKLPVTLEAGKNIVVTTLDDERLTVARFSIDEPDQKRVVSNSLDELIRAIVDLSGTYPDVVQALQQAKRSGALVGRFQIDALPQGGRTYQRKSDETPDDPEAGEEVEKGSDVVVGNPLPDLFSKREVQALEPARKHRPEVKKSEKTEEKARWWPARLGKMVSNDSGSRDD
ncbi:MAG: flagellar basal body P-ring protein FlgI [Planctomycetes bacterium]|nr:flagellar basal body P-ring protein FlgI [Planctomycetota bacterium]